MSHALTRPLPWQQSLWLELTSLILQDRLSHALLLSGPAGIGKRRFARALGAFLLCENRSGYACGQCRSCQQLAVGAHPNGVVLGTEGLLGLAITDTGQHEQGLVHWQPDDSRNEGRKRRDISIDAARKLIERLSLSAHYGGSRVAIVDPADALNSNSVNALLKTIEEPPPATHMLLLSERPQSLTATLRSRCQRVRMPAPDAETAQAWLAEQTGRNEPEAVAAAYGAPLRALEIAQSDALARYRSWAELWTSVGRRRKDPVAAAASVDRDATGEHLQWAIGWMHGLLRDGILHRAEEDALSACTQMLDELIEANRLSVGNAQPQLLLESLFVQWLRLGPKALGAP